MKMNKNQIHRVGKGNFPPPPSPMQLAFCLRSLCGCCFSVQVLSCFPSFSLSDFFLQDWVCLDLGFSSVRVDSPCHYAKSEPIRNRLFFIFE